MITYNFSIANTQRKNGERSIVINFTKDRKNTSLSIGKTCKDDEWSFETSRVKKNHPKHKMINTFIDRRISILDELIDDYDKSSVFFTMAELIAKFKTTNGQKITSSYTDFQNEIIENLKNSNKPGTAKVDKDTLNSLQRFFNKKVIEFNEINYNSLKKYEAYCISRNNSGSTIGIRMRSIRSVFNQAIKSQIVTVKQYPFKEYKISKIKESGKKEFLTEDEMDKLKNYVPKDGKEEFAKDMFLFSFYARGINYIDFLKLEKRSVNNDRINYIRSKTGVSVSFKLNDLAKDIIIKYQSPHELPFVFDFIKTPNPSVVYLKNKTKKLLTQKINPYLKVMMSELDIQKNITYYCARHSFATILKFNNISIETIREALGQKDIKSTMSYLNTLPDNKLDKIIDDVINW